MGVVKIDSSNEKNFQKFKLMEPGRYNFEIAKPLNVEKAKTSNNKKIDIELRCIDDGPEKGSVVWDTIALTPKSEWKLCHLALAAGVQSEDEIKENGIDLDELQGAVVEAEIEKIPPTGNYKEKNSVARYIFDAQSTD